MIARASSRSEAAAALCGALVAAANALAAYALVVYSRRRSTLVFMRAILGGMTLRLGAMLVAIFVAVRVFELAQVPLVLSLLTHFTLFLGLELLAAHRASTAGLEVVR
jgi:ABC-type glycerol-3-phosphate transport system permease component